MPALSRVFSLKVKLIILIVLPLLLFECTNYTLLQANERNISELSKVVYETANQTTSLILNADRDMYQALTAYQFLASGALTPNQAEAWSRDLAQNIAQANERITKAEAILNQHQLLSKIYTQTGTSAQAVLKDYHTYFDQWAKEASSLSQARSNADLIHQDQLLAAFQKGREGLNGLGEALDAYAAQSITALTEQSEQTRQTLTIVLCVFDLVILLVGFFVYRKIMKTVHTIRFKTGQITEGILEMPKQTVYDQDELGKITYAVDEMTTKMIGLIRDITSSAQHVQSAAGELSSSSRESAAAAEHVALNIQEVTQGTEIQSRSASEASRATEEMAHGVSRIAEHTIVIAEQSEHTMNQAEDGNHHLQHLITQMGEMTASVRSLSQTIAALQQRSEKIGHIAINITTFAQQTNLLSLNASIEAARAGEHGQGFAVVAHEIRKLAASSLESAEVIGGMIEETRKDITTAAEFMDQSLSETDRSSERLQEVHASFEAILHSVKQIVTQVHETSAITEQISASSQQVAASMEQAAMSAQDTFGRTESVAAATEEQLALMQNIAAAAEQLESVVQSLNRSISFFKL
ncbi:methyl-accepting chemotaxis protein [Paenibacillus sp. y28]|uniref:methyl-accepting chemotaxis protein n=1 Tax=Paenibacillus sp. y28 TaxID=3129110 RepID=UPI00301AB595